MTSTEHTYHVEPRDAAIYLSDSYKFSHHLQLPPNTQYIQSYLESRGGDFDALVFSGLQYYLKRYLSKRIKMRDVDRVERMCELHGEPFNREGWTYIVEELKGKLPVRIKALPEGTIVKPKDIMLTIENTDPMVPWLTSFLETLILKVWYPTTVASKAQAVKKIIAKYWENTMDSMSGVEFAYHNFGDRGSTSVESAEIAGMAHLTQFNGTDNFNSLFFIQDYYTDECAGFSIWASEHSTVTSWLRKGEYKMITAYLEEAKAKKKAMIACVMDSYDVYKAVDFVTSELKIKIESDDYPIFVIRPDSGDPIEVLTKLLDICENNNIEYVINKKGYKVFKKFRFIWGDGITPETIGAILEHVTSLGYAAGNFAFGSGGNLVQELSRDTCKFAIKACATTINGIDYDVFKDPITDPGKISKKGRQTLVAWQKIGWSDKKISQVQSIRLDEFDPENHIELLEDVFLDGVVLKDYSFGEIRARSSL